MESKKNDTDVSISFSEDEALVFFDWISNFNQREDIEFNDQSEERILWDIEAVLEKIISIQFKENYKLNVLKARANIRDDV